MIGCQSKDAVSTGGDSSMTADGGAGGTARPGYAGIGASAANRENYYQMAYYELDAGESLVIDFEPPPGITYWNLTSATFWHESHRYLTDPVSLTSSEVERRPDGAVRFLLSREDPGHPNWLKTFAHRRGFLIFRIHYRKLN